ncbi:AAA family ATPase [Sphingomonas asaccharolytica]|uniref:AAA family ATPase n=1 Tax=Sphingomonas asaccharolytica TaxID=40681 RepID=UPI000B261C95|nr:ATP-binding protein [Sphingomonas asaccharolytica]
MSTGALHLITGKIAAGKSTLSAKLAAETGGLVLAEDYWLPTLYPAQITSLDDYRRDSGRLRTAIAPLIVDLLRRDLTIILDFPANTVASRTWMRGLADAAGITATLHFLDLPDDICRARLHARNAAGTHAYQASDAEFDQFTAHFAQPEGSEGFRIVRYAAD